MGKITVKTEDSSVEKASSQSISGVIFFDFENYQFPERGWNDFIVVVLCWWLTALRSIVLGHAEGEELRFMDGPLYVRVTNLSNGLCNVDCFDEGTGGGAEFSGQYRLTELFDGVLNAARSTLAICRQNKWNGEDIDELECLVKDLSK